MIRKLHIVLASLSVTALGACVAAQSPAPQAASTREAPAVELPAVEKMSPAHPSSKISVPADVRYQLGGTAMAHQPMTVQIAVVPRIAGQNLRIEFPQSEAVILESGASALVESKAEIASAYRRTLTVTPRDLDRAVVRVIVSMDVAGSRYFGIFSVPLTPQALDKSVPVRNQ